MLEGFELYCVESDECTEILLCASEPVSRVLTFKRSLRDNIFSMGVHVARLCGGEFKPLLGLLNILRGKLKRGYVIVNQKSERVFLYGRDILPEGIIELKPSGCKGLLVVLNEKLEPLGWGKISSGGVVKNLIDLGWYLRSGI